MGTPEDKHISMEVGALGEQSVMKNKDEKLGTNRPGGYRRDRRLVGNILDTARKIKSEVQGVGRGTRDTHHSVPGATTGLKSITAPEGSLQSILGMFQQRGSATLEVRRLHSR